MMKWYFTRNGSREGPVEEKELFEMAGDGRLKPTDFVWNAAMGGQWNEASSVPDLFDRVSRTTDVLSEAQDTGKEELPGRISCVIPLRPAWRRMAEILFMPFSMTKWFILGFSAWLATLGEGGGGSVGSGSRNLAGLTGKQEDPTHTDLTGVIDQIRAFLERHGGTIAWIVAIAVCVGVAIALVVTWARSRGKFMFLDNVLNNRAEIAIPWRTFNRHGNSLFRWNIVYGLVCLMALIPLIVFSFSGIVLPCIERGTLTVSAVRGIVLSGGLLMVFALITGYITRFLEDFVVPIMYKCDLTATRAWGRFMGLLRDNFWRLMLYGVFYVALGMVAGACIFLLIIGTCCIAGCLIAIPYVGAVLVLPVTVFFRVYSVQYLSQFGSEYRLVRDEG